MWLTTSEKTGTRTVKAIAVEFEPSIGSTIVGWMTPPGHSWRTQQLLSLDMYDAFETSA